MSSAFIQQQWTISWLDCDTQQKVDCIQQPLTTSSVDGLRRSSKALPKTKLAPKKGHGHCLVVCCRSDSSQLSESRRNHHMWEVCSTDRWDARTTATPALALVNRKGPILLHDNTPPPRHTTSTSKVERRGLWSFASSAIFTWPLTNWLPLLQESWQLFAWKCSTSSRMQNNFPRVHWILKHGFLCYRNKQTYLLVAKVYWWMVPILINQCIFAPSYTDLKFTVWNCNYFLH